jgi:AcrR family transcriptional regulator
MLSRRPKPNARATTDEQKKEVREDFIAVGRHLFAVEDPSAVSLRRIANEAGYSPGTIYKYFRDHRELFIAIREADMSRAVDNLEKIAGRIADPEERLRKAFLHQALAEISGPFSSFIFNKPGALDQGRPAAFRKIGRGLAFLQALPRSRRCAVCDRSRIPQSQLRVQGFISSTNDSTVAIREWV